MSFPNPEEIESLTAFIAKYFEPTEASREYLDEFKERLFVKVAKLKPTILVIVECLQMGSSQFGYAEVLCAGGQCSISEADALSKPIGTAPSNFKYPTFYWRVK